MEVNMKEITCKICGFITYSDEDMIRHLSGKQHCKVENCNLEILVVKRKRKKG
jgi:hypothetical protein